MMEFVEKPVTSPSGLSQEEALRGVQEHPKFKAGSRIASIRQRGDQWLIKLLEPKTAEFPPSKDDSSDSEESVESTPPSDEESSSDGPPSPDGPPKPPKPEGEGGDEKAEIGEVLSLLHQIVDALGLSPGPEGPEGPSAPPPGPPGAEAAPGHGGARPGAGRPAGPAAGGAKPRPLRDVPPGTNPISGFASAQEMARQIPTFSAVADDDGTTINSAKAELENIYNPYKVKQLSRKQGKLVALLSVR